MLELFLDCLKESAIIFAFVFALHILLSFFEAKAARLLEQNQRYAPAMGSLFGLIPECGTSVVGADLYLKGHLSLGTIIAIFLSCSDEALPILFSDFSGRWYMSFALLGLKLVIGAGVGSLVDLIYKKSNESVEHHLEHCHGESETHVGCCFHQIEGKKSSPWAEHLLHPIIHSLKIFLYVFVIQFLFSLILYWIGSNSYEAGQRIVMDWVSANKALSPLLAVLVGLIPNCVSSVMLATLYLEGALPFGSLLAGLLVNAGLGVMVLAKDKTHHKQTALILGICVMVSLIFGYALLYLPLP